MDENPNHFLQLTDAVTTRMCAVRIDPADAYLPVGRLFDKYLKRPPLAELLDEGRITEESAEVLTSLQDLVYMSTDEGRLTDVFAGVEVLQGPRTLGLEEVPEPERTRVRDTEVLLLDLTLDRNNVGYERNWKGFHRRRWDRNADVYSDFVAACLERELGADAVEEAPSLETTQQRLDLVKAVATRIWESEFENYSRFTGRKLVYKTGDETVMNIVEGVGGGICSEKVQALKFITDHYGLESEYVLAGPDVPEPVPEERLREMLTTFDFRFSRRFMRYWQHLALVYRIDGAEVLVDATNGNIPFMFLRDGEAAGILGYGPKAPVRVKMAVRPEDFYYHRVSQDIPEDLLFAMEGWVPHVDLVQVFDNELGLFISSGFMVAPVVYRSERAYERLRREYVEVCGREGLPCAVSSEWALDSDLGEGFAAQHEAVAARVMDARAHLLARYDDCHGPGHEAGLVVIGLRRYVSKDKLATGS